MRRLPDGGGVSAWRVAGVRGAPGRVGVTTAIRVVVVDDDARLRADLGAVLQLEPDIDVVGAAADGAGGVEICRRLRPDVVVMDVRMPRMDGIEATRRLRTGDPAHTRVLVLTTFDLDDYVLSAVRAGASGFLVKHQAPDALADAVRTVAAGDAIVAPRATARLLRELTRAAPTEPTPGGLTDREIEVVRLMARGLSNVELARAAHISLATAKTHVSSVLAKLGLTSRVQVVVWAYERGLAERD